MPNRNGTEAMTVEVTYSPATNKYFWRIWDGPDGIDEAMGYTDSLGEAFEKIIAARIRIASGYQQDQDLL